MYYGTDYYPEQWSESEWSRDFSLMAEAGFNVVRLGVFAWAFTQPDEHTFDLDWLERSVDAAVRCGLDVVMGTGTASPPCWLTQRYPETLRIESNGRPAQHGARQHYNPVNARYLQFCAQIAEKLAERFGSHPNVIGWQIDNEYGPMSYDEESRHFFQQMLRKEYGTLEELNRRWGTAYWSQGYTDWSQVSHDPAFLNPCGLAAFRRLYTQTYLRYQENQKVAIQRHARPEQFITTNFHGMFRDGDPHAIGKTLDVVGYDYYLDAGMKPGSLDHGQFGFHLDLCRGIKRRKFWQMEVQAGNVVYRPINTSVEPGETRRLIWHTVAHGAEAAMYWQWRPCLGGQEQMWGTLVAANGQPRPIYKEAAQVGAELRQFGKRLRNAYPVSEAAILYSDDNRWAIEHQPFHHEFRPLEHLQLPYRALRRAGQNVDVIHPQVWFGDYSLIFAPHYNQIEEGEVTRLLEFVEAGGHLVLGARTGYKNKDNALLQETQPGAAFAAALGASVREYYALETPLSVEGVLGEGETRIWAEWLEPHAEDCEVLLRYGKGNGLGQGWLESKAALVSRPYGEGRITYMGIWPNAELMDALILWCHEMTPFRNAPLQLLEAVEVSRLSSSDVEYLLIINHGNVPFFLPLDESWQIITGGEHDDVTLLERRLNDNPVKPAVVNCGLPAELPRP